MSGLKKHIYEEKNGLHYTLNGDYYLPDLKLPEEHRPIGKYGRMQRCNNIHNRAEEIVLHEMIYS